MYWSVWIIAAIILLVIEFATVDFVAIWFGISAIVLTVITAIFQDLGFIWQLLIFVALSTVLLVSTRPLVKKFLKRKRSQETNLELIINHTGMVVEPIHNDLSAGAVKINGLIWSARSVDDAQIEEGVFVVVKEIHGNKLIVERK